MLWWKVEWFKYCGLCFCIQWVEAQFYRIVWRLQWLVVLDWISWKIYRCSIFYTIIQWWAQIVLQWLVAFDGGWIVAVLEIGWQSKYQNALPASLYRGCTVHHCDGFYFFLRNVHIIILVSQTFLGFAWKWHQSHSILSQFKWPPILRQSKCSFKKCIITLHTNEVLLSYIL